LPRLFVRLKAERFHNIIRLATRSGHMRIGRFTVSPGSALGRRCLICSGSIDEGGRFVLCPRCRNIYHLDCLMALDEVVCIHCGRPLKDVINEARLITDAKRRVRAR